MYEVESKWQDAVQKINPDVYFAYDDVIKLFELRHKIPFTTIDRRLMYINNHGLFRHIDWDVIDQLKYYDWANIYKYKNSMDLANLYLDKMELEKKKEELARDDERKYMVKENIGMFRKLQDRMRSTSKPKEVALFKKEQDKQDLERSKRPVYHY